MASDGKPTVAVKLFIDKEKSRVVFAESDKDFVDVLFSFLTLPLGTIVRLLGKNSQVGCLDELYKSVENLSEDNLQTWACRAMLLCPVNNAAFHCHRLKVKIDGANQRGFYTCYFKKCMYFSSVYDSCTCECVFPPKLWECPSYLLVTTGDTDDGVFVKSGPKFIITDDLQVTPASTSLVFSLLDRFGLHEQDKIEEKVLQLDSNKITGLLKNALMSKQPLTGLCFDVALSTDAVHLDDQLPKNLFQSNETKPMFSAIKIKLVHTKDNSSVLYAEVGQDFLDILFGLLCVPLGSVIKAYGQSNGCVDSLYRSIDGSAKICMKQDCRSLLLAPKLAPFFSCSRNVLKVEEAPPRIFTFTCFRCRSINNQPRCSCATKPCYVQTVTEMNPKSPSNGSANTGGAYVKGGLRSFLVTSDLRVLDFSLTNTLQVMRAAKIPKGKLVEKELALDKAQVVKLLRAAVLSRDALSSLLSPPK